MLVLSTDRTSSGIDRPPSHQKTRDRRAHLRASCADQRRIQGGACWLRMCQPLGRHLDRQHRLRPQSGRRPQGGQEEEVVDEEAAFSSVASRAFVPVAVQTGLSSRTPEG